MREKWSRSGGHLRGALPDHTGTRRSLNRLRLIQNRPNGISASSGPAITSLVGEMNANFAAQRYQ